MSYKDTLSKFGSFRKAAEALNLTKSKFMMLYKEELGLCKRTTSCTNTPELGKSGCRACLNKVNISTNKAVKKEYQRAYKLSNFKNPITVVQNRKILKNSIGIEELTRQYTDIELNSEFHEVTSSKGSILARPILNRITTHFNPHFYEVENQLWKDDNTKVKLISNRMEYLGKPLKDISKNELLRGFKISGIHRGFSHHSPLWIKYFIEKYNIKSIYDPCGGWGHRLLGSNNIKYIYNDIDPRSCEGALSIIKHFDIKDKIVYNEDASKFTPNEDYEAVFTCPPYFNVEEYTYAETSTKQYTKLEDWIEGFWKNLVKSSINKSGVRYFAFIINHTYLSIMKQVCLDLNLELVEELEVGRPLISHLNKKHKVRKAEYMLVFKKKAIRE